MLYGLAPVGIAVVLVATLFVAVFSIMSRPTGTARRVGVAYRKSKR